MYIKFSENLKLARQKSGYTQKQIAEKLNLSPSAYSLYESGDREPNLETIWRLSQIFSVSIDDLFGLFDFLPAHELRDEAAKYHTRPSCTWEEYYDLPTGEGFAELIDGELVYMCAPITIHQHLVNELAYLLTKHVKENKGPCQVYPAPFAVKLSEERNLILLPDISVICDKSKIDRRGCNGGPDLVIEIVSPSSRKLDYFEKVGFYSQYGVREYWIVDPEKKIVQTYCFESLDVPVGIYSFEHPIPVDIFEGLTLRLADLIEELSAD